MLFTTKTEYGLRAMVALAKSKDSEPLSLSEISKKEHISQSYLEHLFAKLKADDLIVSVRGANGGYKLARTPKQISMFDIVEALEGALAIFQCNSGGGRISTCVPGKCLTRKIWQEVQAKTVGTLRKFTLNDLI
jgi:Rrf2 family protein